MKLRYSVLLLALVALVALPAAAQANPSCPGATGPDPHCASLSWIPPAGGIGTGYNIYTGGTTKGNCATVTAPSCTKLLSVSGLATTSATFNTTPTSFQLADGQTYFFVITTVNGTAESVPSQEFASNAVPFLVPNPPAGPSATAK